MPTERLRKHTRANKPPSSAYDGPVGLLVGLLLAALVCILVFTPAMRWGFAAGLLIGAGLVFALWLHALAGRNDEP